jgi:hypothetical protein
MREARQPIFENRRTIWSIALITVLAAMVAFVTVNRPNRPATQISAGGSPHPALIASGGPSATSAVAGSAGTGSAAAQPTRFGVFLGTKAEVSGFESWVGRAVKDVTHFSDRQTWNDIAHPRLNEWRGTAYRLIYAVPMLPSTEDATKEASMRAGATGDYDAHFTALAKSLISDGQQDAVLRVGWEFNLKSWPWGIKDSVTFTKYFRHIVTAMRAVPGAKFTIDWNPNNGFNPYDAADYWPGGKYVDTIGVDVYDLDQTVYGTAYRGKKVCDVECRAQKQETAWNEVVYGGERGLQYWAYFAQQHHKPLSLPEWGLWEMTNGSDGGGDNPFFIEQMHSFIETPGNNVAYASYFDVDGGDGLHDLMKTFPASGKRFKKLFGK